MNFSDGNNCHNAKHKNMDEGKALLICNINTMVEHHGLEDFTSVCRICASSTTDQVYPIFDGQGQSGDLAEKINKFLPIKVSKDDGLPQGICEQCRSILIAWDELVKCSVQAEIMLQQKLSVMRLLYPDESKQVVTAETTESPMKTKKGRYHFNDLVREVLMDCFNELCIEEANTVLEYVCQMCPDHPASKSVEELTLHLKSTHKPLLQNKQAIEEFVKDNITFEETLFADRDGNTDTVEDDDESVANVKAVKLQNYCCPFCEGVFSSPGRLVYHLNRHIEISITNGMKCCDQLYENKSSFVEHLQNRHVTKILEENICKTCGLTTSNFEELETHVTEAHPESIDFERKEVLVRRYSCNICGKGFNNSGNLARHRKALHTDCRPHTCNICNKAFSRISYLKEHINTHSESKEYLCDICGKASKSGASLRAHRQTHSREYRFSCIYCGSKFRKQGELAVHVSVHTGEKAHVCDCGKAFRLKKQLTNHMKTHVKVIEAMEDLE